jgi:cytoskeleton protein RodZ
VGPGDAASDPAETDTATEAVPGAGTEPGNDPSAPTGDETNTAETGTTPDEEQAASAPPAIPETTQEAEADATAGAEPEAVAEAEPEPTPEPYPEPEPEETAEAEEEPEETTPAYVGRPAPSDVQAVTGDSRIVLRANRDSWIQVRRGGELVVRRLLRRGDTYAVPGGVGFTLNTSNAGGLEVYIDGRRAPNLGPVGAARNGIILSPSRLN